MKLSEWAKKKDSATKGSCRLWKTAQLPVPAEQLPTGTILIKEVRAGSDAVGLYARVAWIKNGTWKRNSSA